MEVLQKALDGLLEKYAVHKKVRLTSENEAEIDGERIPLFPHRSERSIVELKKLVQGGTLQGISAMRTSHLASSYTPIEALLWREIDICRFVLGQEIVSVYAVLSGASINVLAKTDRAVICTIELSTTLPFGAADVDKHEVIAARGTACDKVVDTQINQQSLYVFGKKQEAFHDVDFELYGLSVKEAALVRQAFEAASESSAEARLSEARTLKAVCEAVDKSMASAGKVMVTK